MAETNRQRVPERLVQPDPENGLNSSGLGLAITAHIAQQNGGC